MRDKELEKMKKCSELLLMDIVLKDNKAEKGMHGGFSHRALD
jgi:hypothetical protein